MKHVIDTYTLTLFPRGSRPVTDPTGASPARVGLDDGGLELSVAGLAYRVVNAVESLVEAVRRRRATLVRARSLRQGPVRLDSGQTC